MQVIDVSVKMGLNAFCLLLLNQIQQCSSSLQTLKKLVEWKPPEKRKVSSGTLTPRLAASAPAKDLTTSPKDGAQLCVSVDRGKKPTPMVQKPDSQTPATGVAKPVPRPAMQQAPCTAEIKTIGAFPPLMRAVSWDTVGSLNMRNGGPKEDDGASHSDNLKPPVNAQKLSKLREVILKFHGGGDNSSVKILELE